MIWLSEAKVGQNAGNELHSLQPDLGEVKVNGTEHGGLTINTEDLKNCNIWLSEAIKVSQAAGIELHSLQPDLSESEWNWRCQHGGLTIQTKNLKNCKIWLLEAIKVGPTASIVKLAPKQLGTQQTKYWSGGTSSSNFLLHLSRSSSPCAESSILRVHEKDHLQMYLTKVCRRCTNI